MWIDKLVGFFSPSAEFKRKQYRNATGVLNERGYDAASRGRRTANWRAGYTSANTEIQLDGALLRNRSRELARNNPYARRALKILPANAVGRGIQPSISAGPATDRLRETWKRWANSAKADFSERKTFYAIQRLAFRSMTESGEVLIRRMTVPRSNDLSFQLQVLEADHLDIAKDGLQVQGGGYIRQGIEFSQQGKIVAYWLFQEHPGDMRIHFKTTSVRVPAAEIIHLYEEDRPGQLRGVPHGVASMNRMRDFDQYEDAQLVRQKVAACFSTFITSDSHGVRPSQVNDEYPLERVEPGMIERLRPGENVSFGAPPPAEGYGEYSRKVLQGISAGFDATYEQVTGDLSGVNFSSGRMGWIEFGRFVTEWQEHLLIPVLCNRVFDWFLDYCRIRGIVSEEQQVDVEWTAPRREFIDPKKEIGALVDQVRAGLLSWQEAVRSLGHDPEVIAAQLKTDADMFDSLGLKPYTDPRYDKGRIDTADEEDKDE